MRKIEEIYVHLKPLYDFLQRQMDTIASTNLVKVNGWTWITNIFMEPAEEYVSCLNLDPMPQEIVNYLITENILDLIGNIVNALLELKHSKELFVIESEKANNNLIGMI